MSDVTIYHNPGSGTSRNALALLRASGVEPHVVEYLRDPPDRTTFLDLVARMGLPLRDALREKGTPFAELGLGRPSVSDEERLDAVAANPILINRPIVVTPRGVRLCRPSEIVLDLLPSGPGHDLDKEDGAPFLLGRKIEPGPDFADALQDAGLPADDLAEPGRTFHRFSLLGGSHVAFGGFEVYGRDALLRSIVVTPERRGHGIGQAVIALLMRRAFDTGARTAWLLTTDAARFFEAAGFTSVERVAAPAAIHATRQAAALCPATATLLSRRIAL